MGFGDGEFENSLTGESDSAPALKKNPDGEDDTGDGDEINKQPGRHNKKKDGAPAGAILGWVVSIAACGARLPQIIRILQSKSVAGLDPFLFEADAVCNAISALYHRSKGYPINTYGETVAFSAQSLATVALIGVYSKIQRHRSRAGIFFLAFLAAVRQVLANPKMGREVLETIQSFTMIALQLSRVPQIVRNYTAESTGELSIVPWIVNLLGSSARLYTTVTQLDGDKLLLSNFTLSIVVNAVLALQIGSSK